VGSLLSAVGDPLFQKALIDSLARRDLAAFALTGGLALALYTVLRLSNYFAGVLAQRLKNGVCEDMTLRMFDGFFRIPYSHISRNERGYFVSRIYDEPAAATSLVDFGVQLLAAVVVFVGSVAVCLWLSWKVVLVLTVIVPVLLVLADRFGKRIREHALTGTEGEARLREDLGRAVDSYKNVNLFGLQGAVRGRVTQRMEVFLSARYREVRFASAYGTINGILLSYAEMAVMLVAGYEVLAGRMSVGGLFAFMGAYWRVVQSFRTLAALVPALARLDGQLARIDEFGELAAARPAPPDHADIDLQSVRLALGGREVLRDVSLRVRAGQRVLLRGPNGSGKSTLTHVAAGFLAVDGGESSLPAMGRVSAVLLPFGFIPGTVRDNLGWERMTDAQRERCGDLTRRFGLQERLDQDPGTLSEGEKRKLQTAMALMKDADFYVFDEPLSHVDTPSKAVVMDAITEGTTGRGVLVVLHGDDEYGGRFDHEIVLEQHVEHSDGTESTEGAEPVAVLTH
jgi:ABC-type multidrug transport system fused ATPase/permease subunit